MPSLAPRIHHLAILVRDLAAAEAFYVGLLGLPVIKRHPEADGSLRSIWVGIGGEAFLAIEKAKPGAEPRQEDGPGWHMLVLDVEPKDRLVWKETLSAAGFPCLKETSFTSYFRDSEGNWLGLSHYPRQS